MFWVQISSDQFNKNLQCVCVCAPPLQPPPCLSFSHWMNAQCCAVNQCQAWTNSVLSGKLCSLGWAHYVPRFTSDLPLWSLPAGPGWSGIPSLFMFGGPPRRCCLTIGLAGPTCVFCAFFQELTFSNILFWPQLPTDDCEESVDPVFANPRCAITLPND